MIPESLVGPPETQTLLRLGLVTSLSQNGVEVALEGEIFQAHRSSGCLVDPRPGDRVVLFLPEGHPPIILSIVESEDRVDAPLRTMNFPGGLVVNVSGRPLAFRTRNGLEVDSQDIRIQAGRLTGQFSDCEVISGTLTVTGGILSFMGEKISQFAKTLDRVAEWLHDRAHSANREIETLDRQTSGETMIESESIVSIQSRTTLLSSQELMKIDSDQIHLG